MNETIRLLLVDDCPTLRAGLRQVFQHTPDVAVVGEAGDGRDALAHIKSLHPEVVLLDCQMPGMEGTGGCGSPKNVPANKYPCLFCV